MKRLVQWILLSLLLLGLAFLGALYFFGGLREYVGATRAINQLVGEQRVKAEQVFYGSDEYGIHSGMFAGQVGTDVWIVEKFSLKRYTLDEYSVFTLFRVCDDVVLNKIRDHQSFNVLTQENATKQLWQDTIKSGDFVQILVAGTQHGGTLGNLREIKAYDWWVFAPIDILKQCEN